MNKKSHIDEGLDWSEATVYGPSLWGSNKPYTVEENVISYTEAHGWANTGCGIGWAIELLPDTNFLKFSLTNNSNSESHIRFDFNDSADHSLPVQVQVNDVLAETNSGNQTTIAIPAEGTANIVVKLLPAETKLNNIVMFIDSMQEESTPHEGGSIAVSNISFASYEPEVKPSALQLLANLVASITQTVSDAKAIVDSIVHVNVTETYKEIFIDGEALSFILSLVAMNLEDASQFVDICNFFTLAGQIPIGLPTILAQAAIGIMILLGIYGTDCDRPVPFFIAFTICAMVYAGSKVQLNISNGVLRSSTFHRIKRTNSFTYTQALMVSLRPG